MITIDVPPRASPGVRNRGESMQTQHHQTQKLLNKIRKLSPEKVAVVDDFVEFLRYRDEMDNLVKAAGKLSEKSFQQIWDNPEDAEYDSL